jgi:hypothetical protein
MGAPCLLDLPDDLLGRISSFLTDLEVLAQPVPQICRTCRRLPLAASIEVLTILGPRCGVELFMMIACTSEGIRLMNAPKSGCSRGF